MKVRHKMFVGEMIDDLPDQLKKKILTKMVRVTLMVRTMAHMAHWLADLADPSAVRSLCFKLIISKTFLQIQ